MEKLLTTLTAEQTAPIIAHLEKMVAPQLVQDVSNYAPDRKRIWLPYEAPLSNARGWQVGIEDPKLWQWICYICQTYAGFTPDVALVAKGGTIKPHRDTSYADYRAVSINLGPVTWGYTRVRTEYKNAPQDQSAQPTTIRLEGGEVFEFNAKNEHWTEDADLERWSINAWTVRPGEQKTKFTKFLASLTEGAPVQPAPAHKSSDKEVNMKTYNIHWTSGPKKGTTERVEGEFMQVMNMVKDSGHAGKITKATKTSTPDVKPSGKEELMPKEINNKPFYVMGAGSRSMLTEPNVKEIYSNLEAEILRLADKYDLHLISGMAEGWDEAIAKVALRNGIPYTVMIPNSGYGNYYWGKNSLSKLNRIKVFNELVEGANNVIYVCSSLYQEIDGKRVHANFVRNQAMVDACDAALVYKPESRGTRDAVERLRKANKPFKVYPFTNSGGDDNGGGEDAPTPNPEGGPMNWVVIHKTTHDKEFYSELADARKRAKELKGATVRRAKPEDFGYIQPRMAPPEIVETVSKAVNKVLAPEQTPEVPKSEGHNKKEEVMTTKKTCLAMTKTGDRCSRTVTDADYCWQHMEGGDMEVTYDIDEIMERLAADQPITWMREPEFTNEVTAGLDEARETMPEIWISNDPTPEELMAYRLSFTENIGVEMSDGYWIFAINTGAQRYPFLERLSRHGVKFHLRKVDTSGLTDYQVELTREYNLAWSDSTSTFLMDIHGVKAAPDMDWSLIGIYTNDVKKLTKRLAEITRLVFTWSYKLAKENILVAAPTDDQMADLIKQMRGMKYSDQRIEDGKVQLIDGMNFIRRSALHRRYRHEHRFMVRVMTDEYLIKGDMFAIDDDIFDKVYGPEVNMIAHPDNVKSEIGFLTTGKWGRFNNPCLMTYWVHHPLHDLRYDAQLSVNNPHVMGVHLLERDLKIMMEKIAADAEVGVLPNQQYVLEPAGLHEAWNNGGMEMSGDAEIARNAVDFWVANGLDPRALQTMVFFAMNGVAMQLDKSLIRDEDESNPKNGLHEKFNVRVSNAFRAACSTREMFEMYFNITFDTPATKGFYDPRYGMVWPGIRFIQTFRLHGTHDHDDFHGFVAVKLYGEDGVRISKLKREGVLPAHLQIPDNEDEAIMVLFTVRSPNGAGEYSIMDFDFDTWPEEIPFDEALVPVINTDYFMPSLEEMIPNPANLPGLNTSRVYTKRHYTRNLFEKDFRAQLRNPGFGQICNMLLFYSHVTGGHIPTFMPDELGNIVDATQQGADIDTFEQIAGLKDQFKADFAKRQRTPLADSYVWATRGQTINRKFINFDIGIDDRGLKVDNSPWRNFDRKVYSKAIAQLRQDIKTKYSFYMRNENHTVKWVRQNVMTTFTSDQIMNMARHLRDLDTEIDAVFSADHYGVLPKNKYTHPIAARNKRLALRAVMDKFMSNMLTTEVNGERVAISEESVARRVMLIWVTLLAPRAMGSKAIHGHSDRIITTPNTDGRSIVDFLPAALRHYGYSPDAEVK